MKRTINSVRSMVLPHFFTLHGSLSSHSIISDKALFSPEELEKFVALELEKLKRIVDTNFSNGY